MQHGQDSIVRADIASFNPSFLRIDYATETAFNSRIGLDVVSILLFLESIMQLIEMGDEGRFIHKFQSFFS